MSYKMLMRALAAVVVVAAVTAFDIYRERRDGGPVFIASNGLVTEEQVRQKLAADGWNNVLITRAGRYFQVMGSKDQQTSHFAVDSQSGRLRGNEDDD